MDYDYAVIGAGVVGLAVAAELSSYGRTIVVEKETKFGQGTSSRNSEVVHAGLYYVPGSLKARLCIQGRKIIEDLGNEGKFGYAQIGKYIVAVDERERQLLSDLKANAESCGVSDLRWIESNQLREEEPEVRAVAALFSPHTGIVDSHGLMEYFKTRAAERGADFAWATEVVEIRKRMIDTGYDVLTQDGGRFSTGCLINSAGLYADRVAQTAGMNVQALGLELKWSRGAYYGIDSGAGMKVRHLVYPVPDKARASLGVHVCVDLAGGIRFGPTVEPTMSKVEDYAPPHSGLEAVAAGLSRYLPKVQAKHLYPVMVGIRPKLSAPGEPVRDFYIREECDRGLPGFVNLIGIESPGLTAAPAIAKYVVELLSSRELLTGERGGT